MWRLAGIVLLGCWAWWGGETKAPIPPAQVAPLALITADLELKLKSLQEWLEKADQFEANQEKIVRAASVMACLAQAASEHEDHAQATYQAAALRDACIELREAESHEDSQTHLAAIQAAWAGKAQGEHARTHPWNELISMYDLMEEMNDRNGGLSRSLRRSRGRIEEQLNASTNAVLAIAMLVDHDYVADEDDARQWDKLSHEYQQAMTQLITAIGEKDQDKIAEYYKAGNRACDKCHEAFRD